MPLSKQTPPRRVSRSVTVVSSHWEIMSKTLVVLALFVTPLAVNTSLSDAWEQPKTLILAGLISLAWVSYILSCFQRRTVDWSWHPLDWLVVLIGLGAGISTLTSIHQASSLWGLGSWLSASLPATFSFVSLYFLLSRLFGTRHDRLIAWASLLTGTGLALLLMVFQFSQIPLLPGFFQSSQLLGPISSSASQVGVVAAMFASVLLLLWDQANERWAHWGIAAGVVLSWIVLLILRQPLGWVIFALGMIAVVINQSRGRAMNTRLVTVVVVIAAMGMVIQLTGAMNAARLPSTNDVLLDQTTSVRTAWTAWLHQPVLGSGPATWFHDFVQYRPTSFNTSPNWSLRFIKAAGEWEQQLATGGIVMLGLWAGLLGLVAWWLWRQGQVKSLTITATALIVVVTFLLGFFTTWSLVLLLWLWTGLGLSRAKLSGPTSPTPMGAMVPVGLMVVLLAGGWYWWSAIRVTASDVLYQRGRTLFDQTAPIDQVISTLTRAVRLNTQNGGALVLLSQAETTKVVLDLQQSSNTDLTTLIQPALVHLRQAVATDPHNPALLEDMNNLLNRLSGLVSDVALEANRNFLTLQKLEPANPIHDVGEGQTAMVIRDNLSAAQSSTTVTTQRQMLLEQAVAAYRRALTKKPDYAQGKFALAQALGTKGENDQALALLAELQSTFGQVGQYWVERAIVLNNLKQPEQADQAFTQATTLAPQDSSIYLSWAGALADNNEKDKAKTVLAQGIKAVTDPAQLQAQLDVLK